MVLNRKDLEGLDTFEREGLAEEEETVAPKDAIIEITQMCPLNCKHCFVGDKDIEEMSAEKWFNIMDKLYRRGVENLVIEGGEPTVHEDFYDILEYATQLFEVTVQTSGVADTRLNDFDCNVTISFEYLNPERNNEIRRMSDPDEWVYDRERGVLYEKENKERIQELGERLRGGEDVSQEISEITKPIETENVYDRALTKLKAIDPPKTLRATIYTDNDVLGLAMLAESINANSVFVPLKPVGLGKELRSKAPGSKRLLEVIRDIMTYNQHSTMEHRVEETYWYMMNKRVWVNNKDVFKQRGRICGSGMGRLFVDYQGDVKPCFMLPEEDMGNILEDDIEEIYSNLYDYHERAKEIADDKRCDSCLGGCIAVAKSREMEENPCPMKVKKKALNRMKSKV